MDDACRETVECAAAAVFSAVDKLVVLDTTAAIDDLLEARHLLRRAGEMAASS